jgi:hypothetical protein
MKKPATPALPTAPAANRDDPLEIIEEMIATLSALKDRERDEALRGSYRAAIDRLSALRYRLRVKPETRVIGLSAIQTAAPPPTPEPPQRTLPLGPVPLIVRARPPKKRW